MFYSKSTGGFYTLEIHGDDMPRDVVEITDELHATLLAGQSTGKTIVAGEDGTPELRLPPGPTNEQIVELKRSLVQQHLDAQARALNYDSISNAITYADEPAVPKFQAEGLAFRAWRSLVWERFYEILQEFQDGTRPIPSDEELIAELPQLNLPSA